jgi:hypothetical protein
MPHKCNLKKKGFRQMSMEADPYSLGADNNNFSAGAQGTAESIYGNPQGAMMVAPVELKQTDSSQYQQVAMPKQTSTPPLTNTVAPLSVMPSNYAGITPVNSTATGGTPSPDVNHFMPSNMDNSKQDQGEEKGLFDQAAQLFKPGALLGKRTDQGFESRIDKAKSQGRHAQVARLEKRYKKFSGLQDYKAAKTNQSHLKKEDRTGLATKKRKDVVADALSGPVPKTAAKVANTTFSVSPGMQDMMDKNAKGELFKTKSISELASSLFKK